MDDLYAALIADQQKLCLLQESYDRTVTYNEHLWNGITVPPTLLVPREEKKAAPAPPIPIMHIFSRDAQQKTAYREFGTRPQPLEKDKQTGRLLWPDGAVRAGFADSSFVWQRYTEERALAVSGGDATYLFHNDQDFAAGTFESPQPPHPTAEEMNMARTHPVIVQTHRGFWILSGEAKDEVTEIEAKLHALLHRKTCRDEGHGPRSAGARLVLQEYLRTLRGICIQYYDEQEAPRNVPVYCGQTLPHMLPASPAARSSKQVQVGEERILQPGWSGRFAPLPSAVRADYLITWSRGWRSVLSLGQLRADPVALLQFAVQFRHLTPQPDRLLLREAYFERANPLRLVWQSWSFTLFEGNEGRLRFLTLRSVHACEERDLQAAEGALLAAVNGPEPQAWMYERDRAVAALFTRVRQRARQRGRQAGQGTQTEQSDERDDFREPGPEEEVKQPPLTTPDFHDAQPQTENETLGDEWPRLLRINVTAPLWFGLHHITRGEVSDVTPRNVSKLWTVLQAGVHFASAEDQVPRVVDVEPLWLRRKRDRFRSEKALDTATLRQLANGPVPRALRIVGAPDGDLRIERIPAFDAIQPAWELVYIQQLDLAHPEE